MRIGKCKKCGKEMIRLIQYFGKQLKKWCPYCREYGEL